MTHLVLSGTAPVLNYHKNPNRSFFEPSVLLHTVSIKVEVVWLQLSALCVLTNSLCPKVHIYILPL